VPASRVVSSGFLRKQNLTNVVVMPQGGPGPASATSSMSPAHALQMRAAETIGALAVAELREQAAQGYALITPAASVAVDVSMERRIEAKMKGYEGESCSECGNFTMVRNGTCLKCDTCGGTSGCS
jgi:ribonucleoside-diphosphate reductase alpha chain